MPLIDKTQAKAAANERNEGKGAGSCRAILDARRRPRRHAADLFVSLAAMVMRQNPNLGAKLLDALELTVRQRPEVEVHGGPLGNVTETAVADRYGNGARVVLRPVRRRCHYRRYVSKAGSLADRRASTAFAKPPRRHHDARRRRTLHAGKARGNHRELSRT
jgi:hypothetical protein